MSDNRANSLAVRGSLLSTLSVWRELNNKWIKCRGKHNIKGWNMWVCICLSNPAKSDKSRVSFPPSGGGGYHFERGQYQDDIADLAAVLPPVLRPLQAGDAHVTPLEMLHVAAGAERDRERERGGEKRGGFYKCQCLTSPAAPLDTRGLTSLSLSLSAATGRQYSNVHTHTPESTHKYIAETIPAVL